MTKEMFFELFGEDEALIEFIYEKHDGDESSIDWMEEAKAQISTMKFLMENK